MHNLNWNHLYYFWLVAREGSIQRAAEQLHVTPQTVSGQLRVLEDSIGTRLYQRSGRGLRLTETGELVFQYTADMFRIGNELGDVLGGTGTRAGARLRVGVADVIPKLVAWRLLAPAMTQQPAPRLVCHEGHRAELLAKLGLHQLDLVITDSPLLSHEGIRAFSHLLGESATGFFAVPPLARRLRAGFPASLEGAPLLLPVEGTALRVEIDRWLAEQRVRPQVAGEFVDGALMKAFGAGGAGCFCAPLVLSREVCRQYGVEVVGSTDSVRERFYVITPERRITHPAVLAIRDAARGNLFG